MQQITVGTKYQIVIPKDIRKKIKGLKPGDKVIAQFLDDKTVAIRKVDQNWVSKTRGIAKDAWKNINTTKYLEDLKNEWDRKS